VQNHSTQKNLDLFKVTADYIMGNAEAGERAGNRWITGMKIFEDVRNTFYDFNRLPLDHGCLYSGIIAHDRIPPIKEDSWVRELIFCHW
jgi:hypothetical protein